jgi:hypothetical protein
MHFILTIILLGSFSTPISAADWTGFQGCGLYQVRAIARSIKNIPMIVINEKTQSEIVLTLPIENEPTLAPYINRAFLAEVQIEKKMIGPNGKGIVKNIKTRLPDPLNPTDTGIKLITKSECKL